MSTPSPFRGFSASAGTTVFLELSFEDRFENPATPTAITEEIINAANGQQILQPTTVTPPPSGQFTLEIPIPASLNTVPPQWPWQINRVIISATYADGSKVVAPFAYQLFNPNYVASEQ